MGKLKVSATGRINESKGRKEEGRKFNKKFWEKQIAYFPFTVTIVSYAVSRKKTLVCMRNEVNKRIQFGRLQCWCY
jgi:hypothetical protein